MSAHTVLVTGASGLVGAEVVARLAAGGHTVLALVHSANRVVRNDGRTLRLRTELSDAGPGQVVAVQGDVTAPGLGMEPGLSRKVRTMVDSVVHSAAITDFGLPWATYQSINVDGTENVVHWTMDGAGAPPRLVHVSTAYVCGERSGPVAEAELDVGQRFGVLYEQSKFLAETLVREATAAGLPTAVVRPSMVVGTERSGVVRDFKNMYLVLKVLSQGRVRSVPGFYDALLNLVPVDYVADVIVQAVDRPDDPAGTTFHAVGRHDHSLLDFSNVMAEYPSFHVPRFVSPASFSVDQLAFAERSYYQRVVGLYESYFRRRMRFDDTNAQRLDCRHPSAGAQNFLRKLLDYSVRVGFLGAELPGIAEVLTGLRS